MIKYAIGTKKVSPKEQGRTASLCSKEIAKIWKGRFDPRAQDELCRPVANAAVLLLGGRLHLLGGRDADLGIDVVPIVVLDLAFVAPPVPDEARIARIRIRS